MHGEAFILRQVWIHRVLRLEQESTSLIDNHEHAGFCVEPHAQLGLNALNGHIAGTNNRFLPLPCRVVWEIVQAFEIG